MITSRDRILTTHVGSLPRNETLTELLVKREGGGAVDPKQLAAEMDRAVADIVRHQKVGERLVARQAADMRGENAVAAGDHGRSSDLLYRWL